MKKPELPTIKINIISLFKLYRLVKKLVKQLNQKAMCFKKWFSKPDPETIPEFTNNTVESIVIGDYPGNANDLNGPPVDQIKFKDKLLSIWSHYTFRLFKDSESTKSRFKNDLTKAVSLIKEGDLLLFIMDNCFSESNTKEFKSRSLKANNYISISACLDHETAADAVFNDVPSGALHFALIETMQKGITYRQWHDQTKAYLKSHRFAQTCTIEGPDNLLDRQIFEGNVICFEISSHGTNVPDRDGDESDKKDEAVCFYDGIVIDDEINNIISTNKYLI